MSRPWPRIPYREADFRRIRLNRWLYVDKTRFVRPLEDERYVFFIRPRRFGKTCWLSLLENYYDRRWAREFDTVFVGTDLGREPTAERHRYVVLRFATLKAGTERSGGGLERLFITGVSPVTMDDVTSGFNIGTNLSLEPAFNEMLGFTSAEVRRLVERYRDHGAFSQDIDTALGIMREWYDGYRFAEEAETDLYNTDMVLYYLQKSLPNRRVPTYLIDTNVRIDYGKLRHLLVVNRRSAEGSARLNGNFDLLRSIIGTESADAGIKPSFPLKRLIKRENFLSLLHFFGLLSIRETVEGVPRLAIPNQTVKRLMYEYLREAYEDAGAFDVNLYEFGQRMMRMANQGEWRPVFAFLAEAIAAQTAIRDYIAGEKVLEPRAGALGFLAAYL